MSVLCFRIVNVFTEELGPFTGNPLCVFEDGSALDTARMQALARQFNLSETVFILPSKQATVAIRIFTPAYEMSFAGHPTLGSAYVARALGYAAGPALSIETQAGVIPIEAHGPHFMLEAPPASHREPDMSLLELAAALGLSPEDLDATPLWVNAGKEQLIVPLTSEAAVRRAEPRAREFARIASRDGHSMAFVFAASSSDPRKVLARFFFLAGGGVLEDPATGSAAANLGGYLLATGRGGPIEVEIAQGQQVHRPSRIQLRVTPARRIFVGGDVVQLASGVLPLS